MTNQEIIKRGIELKQQYIQIIEWDTGWLEQKCIGNDILIEKTQAEIAELEKQLKDGEP